MDSRPGDEMLLAAVWQKPRGFRGDGDIAAWLWGIEIRRLVSRLRARAVLLGGLSAVRTFPAPGAHGPSSDPCGGSFSPGARWPSPFSVGGRRLPRWMSRVP
jgi:hypothetical protein